MTAPGERVLLVMTPAVALAVVAMGLRLGARGAGRAAIVYAAPRSGAGTGLAWQVAVFDERHGTRESAGFTRIDVSARASGGQARWSGATNEDGVAEVQLDLPSAVDVTLEVTSGGAVLAAGPAGAAPHGEARSPGSAWARFARREGPVALDVAIRGQRVASGFPSSVWVHASDDASGAALAGVAIEAESDESLSVTGDARTDARGWAHLTATPMGFAVALVLSAASPFGGAGRWAGALVVSPGADAIVTRDRFSPDESPSFEITAPGLRSTAYLEIDDAFGRAWGAAAALQATGSSLPHASVRAPRLTPGLYFAVASGDPTGAARLGPGSVVRPFFVAATDEAALAYGTDREACTPAGDRLEVARVVAGCLALAAATPAPRAVALDGFVAQHARDAGRRAAGLSVALGALLVAVLLETVLVLRASRPTAPAAATASALLDEGPAPARTKRLMRATAVTVSLSVALLGFALLAAFLIRAG
jgi:hypothetical protein